MSKVGIFLYSHGNMGVFFPSAKRKPIKITPDKNLINFISLADFPLRKTTPTANNIESSPI